MHHPGSFTRTLISAAAVLTVAASVVACSGGSASTAPGASIAATTQPGASVAAPSVAAPSAAASTAAGGGTLGAACDLLTAAEAAGAVGSATLTTDSVPGDPSYCSYRMADGNPKVMTSYGVKDAKVGFDTWKSAQDSVAVAGVGDGAVWVPSLATLLVLKGDRVLGITAGSGSDDESQRIDWSKALAAIAVARM